MDVGAVNSHFSVYGAIFGIVTTNQTINQLGDPSASQLWTSEKAVFCNSYIMVSMISYEINNERLKASLFMF